MDLTPNVEAEFPLFNQLCLQEKGFKYPGKLPQFRGNIVQSQLLNFIIGDSNSQHLSLISPKFKLGVPAFLGQFHAFLLVTQWEEPGLESASARGKLHNFMIDLGKIVSIYNKGLTLHCLEMMVNWSCL